VRHPDEYADLMERSAADRNARVITGISELVDRNEILLADRQSAALSEAARQQHPNLVSKIPLEFVDETAAFNPEWVVDKISPRPILFITTDNDRLTTPEQTEAMFALAGDPKKLVVLKGFGHYEIYSGEAFRQESSATVSWFDQYLPALSLSGQ
jgi:pimeloyl-ACP methyl ester carboxylesterase